MQSLRSDVCRLALEVVFLVDFHQPYPMAVHAFIVSLSFEAD